MEIGTVKKVLKKLQRKYWQILAQSAGIMTLISMRNDCVWFFYQEELPEEINDTKRYIICMDFVIFNS